VCVKLDFLASTKK